MQHVLITTPIAQMGHEQTTVRAASPQLMCDEDLSLKASSQPGLCSTN